MNLITFSCGKCHQVLKVGADKAGKRAKCPKCANPLLVPSVQAPPPPAARPPAPPLVDQVDVVDEVEEVPARPPRRGRDEEYEDQDEGRRPRRPRDDEDDYDDQPRKKRKKASARHLWPKVNVGLLIVAIAACAVGGAFLCRVIGDLILTISFVGKSAPSSSIKTMLNVSSVLFLLASLGAIAGYVFCLFVPNKGASLGLGIATLIVGGVNLILGLVFLVIPLVGGTGEGGVILTLLLGAPDAGSLILTIVYQLAFGAEFILFCLFLSAVAVQIKEHGLARDYTGLIIFVAGALFLYVLSDIFGMVAVKNRSNAMFWIKLITLWFGHILFGVFLGRYIMSIFGARAFLG